MFVEYLPYWPQAARLQGSRNDSFSLWLGVLVLGGSLFCGVKFYQANRFGRAQQALRRQLAVLLAKHYFDQALAFTLAVPDDEQREMLLAILVIRLFKLGEAQRARDILARKDVPDLKKALQNQGMELR